MILFSYSFRQTMHFVSGLDFCQHSPVYLGPKSQMAQTECVHADGCSWRLSEMVVRTSQYASFNERPRRQRRYGFLGLRIENTIVLSLLQTTRCNSQHTRQMNESIHIGNRNSTERPKKKTCGNCTQECCPRR